MMTSYGIIISHETFKFVRYNHKALGECVYQVSRAIFYGIPLESDR